LQELKIFQRTESLHEARWWETLNVNLSACMWAGREIGRHMMSRRQGAILIIGSTVTIAPAAREAAYRVSKTGLRAYAETLALEMAPFGIRVNMLTPGAFDTPLLRRSLGDASAIGGLTAQIPLGRIGQPHECALAACFLLSDSASPYTTGAELFVDGGLRLRPLSIPTERLQEEG
jgi:NAD(P)-dependent dehydrogenase (short-subunit alcohol dehydrogenase family)